MNTARPVQIIAVSITPKVHGDQAVSQAFLSGALRGQPVVVEPVMRLDLALEASLGSDVMQDLVGRGARIVLDRQRGETRTIVALVRVARMFGLAADLARSTAGIGTYSMQFDRYESISAAADEPNLDDEDRDSLVGAPRKPLTPDRTSAIALPEPEAEEDDDAGEWPPRRG